MNYPEFAEINGKRYKINTDYRIAIECNRISSDENISDFERTIAIIYKLFGEDAIDEIDNYQQFIDVAIKFLTCNKEINSNDVVEKDMDYTEDMDYIEASFMSDYNIDISEKKIHWWKFFKLLNGLSNNEFGSCCILNRIRNLRNYDVSKITDQNEKDKILRAKKMVALKSNIKKEFTKEQEDRAINLLKQLNLKGSDDNDR